MGGPISEETLWSCTTCGYCEVACPIGIEHLSKFFRLRQRQVMMEGEFPSELNKLFQAYESAGNPWGLDAGARGDWAKSLGVPVVSTPDEVAALDYLYYVGSASSFDPRGQKIARAFVKVAQAAGVKIGILGAGEGSTGECVRRLGNEMVFQELATTLVDTLNGVGAKRIVTTDPHAFNALKNELGEFGGHYDVVHHTQAIDAWITSGRLKVKPTHERVIYHEPCYLGRHNKEYDAPRRILYAVSKDGPLEFDARARQGDVLRRRRRPHVAGGNDRHAHQRAARRAGDGKGAGDGGDRVPLLRGDGRRRPRAGQRQGPRARHRRTRRRRALSLARPLSRGVSACARTRCRCSPSPATPSVTTSPGFRYRGGLRPIPTPGGVPVAMMSPGSSVMNWLT